MQVLRIDQVTVEAYGALSAAGIEPILLKGPALETWTLPERRPRSYNDSDLLVAPAEFARARTVLHELGFEQVLGIDEGAAGHAVAEHWLRRPDMANVDLHRSIIGMGAPAARVWEVLQRHTEPLEVAGHRMRCLDAGARALHVALHAVQQGEGSPQVFADLRGALTIAERSVWDAAVGVADEVDALPALAAGLRTVPAGLRLAEELALPTYLPMDVLLRRTSETPLTLGIESLVRAPGWRARLRLLLRELFPSHRFMRVWAPRLTRLGAPGLAIAYLLRPAWLLVLMPRALLTWTRARRASARSG